MSSVVTAANPIALFGAMYFELKPLLRRLKESFPGARLAALVNGRAKLCTVAPMPFFDPENARLRA